MSGLAVVIPFKSSEHKSRLSSMLDPSQRRELALVMLGSVLAAVRGARLVRRCFVVTRDADAVMLAEKAGATCLRERADSGVNSAVRSAMSSLREFDYFMVLPGDLPSLSPSDLTAVLAHRRDGSVIISPSAAFTGTNLLLFDRGHAPRLSYDRNSFWNHLASAAAKRLTVDVCTRLGIIRDLDDVGDVKEILRSDTENNTRRYLRRVVPQ